MTDLDKRIAELSAQYLPLAAEILEECIRIPADSVDRPVGDGGDPSCGLSNHEGPRLEYLRQTIIDIGAVGNEGGVAHHLECGNADRFLSRDLRGSFSSWTVRSIISIPSESVGGDGLARPRLGEHRVPLFQSALE